MTTRFRPHPAWRAVVTRNAEEISYKIKETETGFFTGEFALSINNRDVALAKWSWQVEDRDQSLIDMRKKINRLHVEIFQYAQDASTLITGTETTLMHAVIKKRKEHRDCEVTLDLVDKSHLWNRLGFQVICEGKSRMRLLEKTKELWDGAIENDRDEENNRRIEQFKLEALFPGLHYES